MSDGAVRPVATGAAICPSGYVVELHGRDRLHGDVCRALDGDYWTCPIRCTVTHPVAAPYCIAQKNRDETPGLCRVSSSANSQNSQANTNIAPHPSATPECENGCRPKMHTFWEQVADLDGQTASLDADMLALWTSSWEAAGFDTRVLKLADAMRHPDYDAMRTNLSVLGSAGILGSNIEYDSYCFLRYLAMGAVGGGWMSDYDALPLVIPPSLMHNPNDGIFTRRSDCASNSAG